MRSIKYLKIVQYRDCMLYAQSSPGRITPLLAVAGIAVWLGAVRGALSGFPWPATLVIGTIGLGILAEIPLILLSGAWLMIDRQRGWIHWRAKQWPRSQRESFSPLRIETLQIVRRGARWPGLGWWELLLKVDHPRLGRVRLAWTPRLGRAQRLARRLAGKLATGWLDERGLLHVGLPEAPGAGQVAPAAACEPQTESAGPWPLPPPPEIQVEARGARTRLVLSNPAEVTRNAGAFLFYALTWCLWAWSGLLIKGRSFGPPRVWDGVQSLTMGLLIAGSLVGLFLLLQALQTALGEQVLEQTSAGGWLLTRRWLGLSWSRQSLEWKKQGWLRRIDPPGEESGLWIPGRHYDIRLGAGLSPDTLAWLQHLLADGAGPAPEPGPAPGPPSDG